jgi:hypothetical protein
MSAARRQAIRTLTIDLLKAARTDADVRVYPCPIIPQRRDRTLPAIGVYTLDERGTPLSSGVSQTSPFQFHQTLDLRIEALVELPTDPSLTPDDRLALDVCAALDTLCEQIERALRRNPNWYLPCDGPDGLDSWTTHQELGRVEDTDRRTAAAIITALVTYTDIDEPEILDELQQVQTGIDVIGPVEPAPDGTIDVQFVVPRPGDPPLWPADRAKGD